MNLLEMIKTDKPHFADEIIEEPTVEQLNDIDMFTVSEYFNHSESVNVGEICGTYHPDYYGKSWLHLLMNGKRMGLNLRLLSENPQYYFETQNKQPSMHIKSIDGKKYIIHDGNHRTCIAKFFFYYEQCNTLHGISYTEYITNQAFKRLYHKLKTYIGSKAIPASIEVLKECYKREDGAGWKRDYYSLRAKITNHRNGYEVIADEQALFDIVAELQNPLKVFMGKYKKLWSK